MSSRRAIAQLAALARPEGVGAPSRPIRPAQLAGLLELTEHHGVLPIVMANLGAAATSEPAASVDAIRKARATVDTAVGFSMLLRHRGQTVSQELTRRGVPHTILKGSSFADALYDPPSLRTFTDIDLLIPQSAWPGAAEALTALGLAEQQSPGRKHTETYGEQTFADPAEPTVAVELHWNLVNSPTVRRRVGVAFEDLCWESPAGGPARPTPASMLLITAVHAATSHGFNRLTTLCDGRQVLLGRAGEVDLNQLQDLLDRTGAGLAVAALLRLIDRVYGLSAAGRMLEALTLPRGVRRRARWCARPALLGQSSTARLARSVLREILKRS